MNMLAEGGAVSAIVAGATSMASDVTGALALITPIAFGVVAGVFVVKKIISVVKGIMGKA